VVADAVKWLCTSPRRLAVTVGGLILLAVIGGSAFNQQRTTDGAAGAEPTPTSVSGAAVPDAKPYVDAAVRFVDAWSVKQSGETDAEWHERVSELTTPELAAALKETDTATLPGSGPSGSPSVRYVTQDSGQVAVPLEDGDTVVVTVVSASRSTWRVSDVQPDVGDYGDAP
jgi:hypothetical protein